MTLVRNWNFFLCFLLNKIGLEIMFPDLPVKKQAYLDCKIRIYQVALWRFFVRGTTHDFGQKLEFFPMLAFKQNRP